MRNRNEITISGRVADLKFSHESHGERMFLATVEAERQSGTIDKVPVMIPERVTNEKVSCGEWIRAVGEIRTFNFHDGSKMRLFVYVFARTIEFLDEPENENKAEMDGYICKSPLYRKTPLGREITDILLAVNRQYGKSDYIPCLCWGRNARYATGLNVGDVVKIVGRFQSRDYRKRFENGDVEMRTAYEVSCSSIEKAGEGNESG